MTKDSGVPQPIAVRLIFQPGTPKSGSGTGTCNPQPALEMVLLHAGSSQGADRMIERLWGHTSTPVPVDAGRACPLNPRGVAIPCDLVRRRRLKNR